MISGMYALFGKSISRLGRENWGTKIKVDRNGKPTTNPLEYRDTAVQPAIDELIAGMMDIAPIYLGGNAVVFNYDGDGPVMRIITESGKGIVFNGPNGQTGTFNVVNGITGALQMLESVTVVDNADDPVCVKDVMVATQTVMVENGLITNWTKPLTDPTKAGSVDLREFCDCDDSCPDCCGQCQENCPDGGTLPEQITLTMYDTHGLCPHLDGRSVTLCDPERVKWWSNDRCDGGFPINEFNLFCHTSDGNLAVVWNCASVSFLPDPGSTCSPLHLVYSDVDIGGCCGNAPNLMRLEITE